MKILGFNIGKEAPVIVNEQKSNGNRVGDYPEQRQKYRTREDIRKLELAIEQYDNLVNYDREDLNRIFRRVTEDPMLSSQWDTRRLKTKDKEFQLTINDEENEDATYIFEASWFLDYIDAMLDSKLWGFTLVQFGAIDNNKFIPYMSKNKNGSTELMYDAVTVVDRDYVKPELGIVTNMPGDSTGISFMDSAYDNWLIFEGKAHDAGLLSKMAKYLLFKENVLGNWSEWAEVFGMDAIIGKTDAEGDERNKFVKSLMRLSGMKSGVFDENDEIEYIGTSNTDAYQVYKELASYVDEQIAKLIFGQDVVSNNTGKVVGSVGENISNLYGDSDAKFIQRNVNDKLIPLMIRLGFTGLEGVEFEWDSTEAQSLTEKVEQDLKIAQMGFNLDPEYIEKTYNTKLSETEPIRTTPVSTRDTGAVNNLKEQLDKFYGKDV